MKWLVFGWFDRRSACIETTENDGAEGMPHFNGMASFSANNWDLSTRLMIPGPAVTIGTNANAFEEWTAVPSAPRTYTIQNSEPPDSSVQAGELITSGKWIWEEAVIRNFFQASTWGPTLGLGYRQASACSVPFEPFPEFCSASC